MLGSYTSFPAYMTPFFFMAVFLWPSWQKYGEFPKYRWICFHRLLKFWNSETFHDIFKSSWSLSMPIKTGEASLIPRHLMMIVSTSLFPHNHLMEIIFFFTFKVPIWNIHQSYCLVINKIATPRGIRVCFFSSMKSKLLAFICTNNISKMMLGEFCPKHILPRAKTLTALTHLFTYISKLSNPETFTKSCF